MSDSLSDTTKAKLDGALTLVVKFQHQRNALQTKVYELTAENKRLNTDLRIALSVQGANGFKLALEAKVDELTAALKVSKMYFESIAETKWAYDGDCGANNTAELGIDAIEAALKEGE